jgi:Fur family transcriptional regulator, ferric uptake regulator
MEAEHVVEALRSEGRSVSTASVYRALRVLTELGLLQRVAVSGAPIRFELVLPDGGHHHHIVCAECGRTEAFDDEKLEAAVAAVSRRVSFRVDAHDVTLHGVCKTCEVG